VHWNWIGKRYAARERRATTPTSNPLHLATSTWKNHDWLIHAGLAARLKLTKPKLQACRGARALRFFELPLCMIRFFHFYLGSLLCIHLTFQFNRNCFSHTALDPALKFCPLSTARPARLGKGPQSTSYRRSLASLSLHARAAASPRARCATTQLASTAPPPIGLSPTPAAGERPDARGTFCAHAGSTCSRPVGFTRGDYLYHHTTNHVLC